MERRNISSGSPWEPVVGYSRAVRVGPFVYVAGTTAINSEGRIDTADPYEQAMTTLRRIETALREAGAEVRHVVRTRIYVTDIGHFPAIGRAHAEFFRDIRPASTLVQVTRLVTPEMLVEIEVDAVIPGVGDER